jgi:hypothetical protein
LYVSPHSKSKPNKQKIQINSRTTFIKIDWCVPQYEKQNKKEEEEEK